jgi:hypothetical protein
MIVYPTHIAHITLNILGVRFATSGPHNIHESPSGYISLRKFSGLTIANAMKLKTKDPQPNAPKIIPVIIPQLFGKYSHPQINGER